jgi:phosphoribosylaminoimidazole (AIR) synthetase
VGFAVYVDQKDAVVCLGLAKEAGYESWQAGTVLRQGQRKAVEIEPLGITFEADTLQVRPIG